MTQIPKKLLKQAFVTTLEKRLKEENPLIQVVLGPRQVGKTTGVQMIGIGLDAIHYATADDTLSQTADWITEQWQIAKVKSRSPILIIDEVQKVMAWSERIKALWDAEKRNQNRFKLVLLGSSSLALQRGLDESLAGRFEVIRAYHWTFEESKEQFGYGLNDYLVYGGYPESARFVGDYPRWQSYLKSSIIETVIGKDILRQSTVRKPALFRQTFEVIAAYPAQEVSYTKLLGQLQESGNTDLVKHYIELFEGAFLFRSLQKYSGSVQRQKSSSPKLIPLCPSLHSYRLGGRDLLDPDLRGRLFESVVGSELSKLSGELHYWRDSRGVEVDFVWELGRSLVAIEVKSGRRKSAKGILEFVKQYPKAKTLFVTVDHFEVFLKDPERFIERSLS